MVIWYTVGLGSLVQPPNSKAVAGNVSPPCFRYIFYIYIYMYCINLILILCLITTASWIPDNPKLNILWWVSFHMKFLKHDNTLFIKFIYGYLWSIVCKIIFGVLCLTLKWNSKCYKIVTKLFYGEHSRNQKLNHTHSISYYNWYKKTILL